MPSINHFLLIACKFLFLPAPRIVIAALYKHLNEKMKLLWTPTMKMNTVHVSDVVAAMWKLGE
jgi:hypothetical protein